MFRTWLTALVALGLAVGTAGAAHAQATRADWPAVDLQIVAGKRNALIEGTCASGGQSMAGASIRYHSPGGAGIGLEVVQVRACERQVFTYYHPHLSVMAQATRDFLRSPRVRPYAIGAGGLVRHRSRFAPPEARFEFAAGAGVSIRLPRRLLVSSELQIGGPVVFTRFTVSVGFTAR